MSATSADETTRYQEAPKSVMAASDGSLYLIGSTTDVSEMKERERELREGQWQPDAFFYAHRAGRSAFAPLADYTRVEGALEHPYWHRGEPESMLIEEVETLWSAIADHDDWQPVMEKVERLRLVHAAHGEPPMAAGHVKSPYTSLGAN